MNQKSKSPETHEKISFAESVKSLRNQFFLEILTDNRKFFRKSEAARTNESRRSSNKIQKSPWGTIFTTWRSKKDLCQAPELSNINQDRFVIPSQKSPLILGVADGVGSHATPEISAHYICQFFSKVFDIEFRKDLDELESEAEQIEYIENRAIDFLNSATEIGSLSDSTTFSGGIIWKSKEGNNQMTFVNAGDSRLYSYSPDKKIRRHTFDNTELGRWQAHLHNITKLLNNLKNKPAPNNSTTHDDTPAQIKIFEHEIEITKKHIQNLNSNQVINKFLGGEDFDDLHPSKGPYENVHTFKFEEGTLFFACTDGLTDNLIPQKDVKKELETDELQRIFRSHTRLTALAEDLETIIRKNVWKFYRNPKPKPDDNIKGLDDLTIQFLKPNMGLSLEELTEIANTTQQKIISLLQF